MVLLNDIKPDRVLAKDIIDKMKNFLEGEGFEVNKKKGEKSLEFKDTYSIITSNELP